MQAPTASLNSAFLDNSQPLHGTCLTSAVNYVEAAQAPLWVGLEDIAVAPGDAPPAFRALGDYGGPVPVHAPTSDSPVIGRSTCRGAPRPTTGCTLGPVEYGSLGDHCEAGGQRIDTGLELDASGILDADEIENTRYVCHAPTLPETLFEMVGFATLRAVPLGRSAPRHRRRRQPQRRPRRGRNRFPGRNLPRHPRSGRRGRSRWRGWPERR